MSARPLRGLLPCTIQEGLDEFHISKGRDRISGSLKGRFAGIFLVAFGSCVILSLGACAGQEGGTCRRNKYSQARNTFCIKRARHARKDNPGDRNRLHQYTYKSSEHGL